MKFKRNLNVLGGCGHTILGTVGLLASVYNFLQGNKGRGLFYAGFTLHEGFMVAEHIKGEADDNHNLSRPR